MFLQFAIQIVDHFPYVGNKPCGRIWVSDILQHARPAAGFEQKSEAEAANVALGNALPTLWSFSRLPSRACINDIVDKSNIGFPDTK